MVARITLSLLALCLSSALQSMDLTNTMDLINGFSLDSDNAGLMQSTPILAASAKKTIGKKGVKRHLTPSPTSPINAPNKKLKTSPRLDSKAPGTQTQQPILLPLQSAVNGVTPQEILKKEKESPVYQENISPDAVPMNIDGPILDAAIQLALSKPTQPIVKPEIPLQLETTPVQSPMHANGMMDQALIEQESAQRPVTAPPVMNPSTRINNRTDQQSSDSDEAEIIEESDDEDKDYSNHPDVDYSYFNCDEDDAMEDTVSVGVMFSPEAPEDYDTEDDPEMALITDENIPPFMKEEMLKKLQKMNPKEYAEWAEKQKAASHASSSNNSQSSKR